MFLCGLAATFNEHSDSTDQCLTIFQAEKQVTLLTFSVKGTSCSGAMYPFLRDENTVPVLYYANVSILTQDDDDGG